MAELSASEKKDKEYHVSVRWALDYIDRHISEKLNMAFLANKRNLNYSYFSQLFKKETGYTFSDYVNMRRMQIAGERLLEGAGTEEVSEAVGFESVKSFFRAFKIYYKMSPSAWKKEHSGRN
ncbi:MAG: helix-turn-helix domain-containing protein [Eisenbergiella sp.]